MCDCIWLCAIVWFTLTLDFWYLKQKNGLFFLRLEAVFLSYVITQGICNKFIEMNISVGCMVWPVIASVARLNICQILMRWSVGVLYFSLITPSQKSQYLSKHIKWTQSYDSTYKIFLMHNIKFEYYALKDEHMDFLKMKSGDKKCEKWNCPYSRELCAACSRLGDRINIKVILARGWS